MNISAKKLQNYRLVALFGVSFILLYLSSMNLSLSHQAYFGWGMVIFLLIARKFNFSETPLGKIFLLTLVTFVSFRYLVWRTTDTLVYTYIIEFIFVALIFISEIEVAFVHMLGIFSNSDILSASVILCPSLICCASRLFLYTRIYFCKLVFNCFADCSSF